MKAISSSTFRESSETNARVPANRAPKGAKGAKAAKVVGAPSVTVRDVAQLAGVSVSTVSRVLNNYADIRDETRRRVLKAAKELGYQPNHVARSMVLKKTFTLGLVVSDLSNPFYGETARIITATARQFNYEVFVCNTYDDPQVLAQSIKALRMRRVDGILCGSAQLGDPVLEELVTSRFPLVMYNRKLDHPDGHYIVLDNERAGFYATEHLLSLGHTAIAFVAGHFQTSTARDRQQGYLAALERWGIPVNPSYIRYGGYDQWRASVVVQELMGGPNPPTALVCANDVMALGALDAVLRVGIRVPENVSIVGFDDIEVAGHHAISLTTVAQNKEQMGRLAVEKLVALIDGKINHPLRIVLPPNLIVRGTTGRPPRRGQRAAVQPC